MKRGIGVATAALATAFAGGAAQAQQSCIEVGAGWTRIDSADVNITHGVSPGNPIIMSVDLDDDWVGHAAYGWDLGALPVEGQVGITAGDAIGYRTTRPANITRPTDGWVNLVSGMANAYWDIDIGPGLTPFVGVGAGLITAEVEVIGPRPTAPNGASVTLIDDDQTNFGWQAMAGLTFPI